MKADKQLIINKKITLGYNINQFFSETKYKIIFVPKFPTKNYYFKGKKKSKLMVGKNSFFDVFFNNEYKRKYLDMEGSYNKGTSCEIFMEFTNQEHNFFTYRWLVQTIANAGLVIPFFTEVDLNERLHFEIVGVGQGKICSIDFLNMDYIPTFLFYEENKYHDFITNEPNSDSANDFLEILSSNYINIESYDDVCKIFNQYSFSNHIDIDDMAVSFFELNKDFFYIRPRGDWKYICWNYDRPKKYYDLVKKSLPLNIFIGTNDKNKFNNFCSNIINNLGNMKEIDLIDQIKFTMVSYSNIYDIPINNDGLCIYLNSDITWNKNIFELLYFGNTNIAISMYDEKLILFNCDHSFWKEGGNIDTIIEKDIGIIPNYYTYI
tara:strand:- start:140 stop:1273 length:1134 start_codon:yes stop_codon:yes gene_type:complete